MVADATKALSPLSTAKKGGHRGQAEDCDGGGSGAAQLGGAVALAVGTDASGVPHSENFEALALVLLVVEGVLALAAAALKGLLVVLVLRVDEVADVVLRPARDLQLVVEVIVALSAARVVASNAVVDLLGVSAFVAVNGQ